MIEVDAIAHLAAFVALAVLGYQVGFRRAAIGNLQALGAISNYVGLRAIDPAIMPIRQVDPAAETNIIGRPD